MALNCVLHAWPHPIQSRPPVNFIGFIFHLCVTPIIPKGAKKLVDKSSHNFQPAISRLSWTHPHIDKVLTPHAGYSLVAVKPIQKGEILLVWGGIIINTVQLKALPEMVQHRAIQVEEDLHLASGLIDELADCANHSCNPNAGLSGQIGLCAMRDIVAGEEICFDYAMSDGDPNFYMPCACGNGNCRGAVTGNDWQRPDLQARYAGYFSPYIQRRIDALNAAK